MRFSRRHFLAGSTGVCLLRAVDMPGGAMFEEINPNVSGITWVHLVPNRKWRPSGRKNGYL
jgi:hypothetical protein